MTRISHTARHFVVFGLALLVGGLVVATPTSTRAETPISGNFDLRAGPYYPSIDDEFSDSSPFRDIFGPDNRTMGQLHLEGYVWQGHGKLGIGANIGYTSFGGTSEVGNGDGNGQDGNQNDGDGDQQDGDSLTPDEETKFNLYPLGVTLAYRWDFLAQEFNIPFALRIEGGLDYFLWRTTDGSGKTSVVDGRRGAGGVPGFHGTFRLEFLLDALSNGDRAFDAFWGINNTYLFAQYSIYRVDNFGGPGFNFNDTTWELGLSLDF